MRFGGPNLGTECATQFVPTFLCEGNVKSLGEFAHMFNRNTSAFTFFDMGEALGELIPGENAPVENANVNSGTRVEFFEFRLKFSPHFGECSGEFLTVKFDIPLQFPKVDSVGGSVSPEKVKILLLTGGHLLDTT